MNLLSLKTPGFGDIQTPSQIPTGGKGMLEVILRTGVQLFLFAGILFALIMIIYGGIQWIMSEGDKQKVQAARARITFSIIGLVLMFLSFFIISIIGNFFSIEFFTQP